MWKSSTTRRINNKPIYGLFSFNGGKILAHRFAWLATRGRLPEKPYLCHQCDNGLCVNPTHLFEGTALENNRDAIAKNRVRHYGRPVSTPEQVVEIRRLYATKKFTYQSLADSLGLPLTRVYSALRKWKTLPLYAAT